MVQKNRKLKVICISGTPGTGKTTLSNRLSKRLKCLNLNVKKIIKEYNLAESFDYQMGCKVISIPKLNKVLIKKIKDIKLIGKYNEIIIESHLSHYLPKKIVNLCIITKCELGILKKRLERRKYNAKKVRENLDAEIFDICRQEAIDIGHNIITVETEKKVKIDALISKIKSLTAT